MYELWRAQGLSAEACERLVYWGGKRPGFRDAQLLKERMEALHSLLPEADVGSMVTRSPMLVAFDVAREGPLRVEVAKIIFRPAAGASGVEGVLERCPRLLLLEPWRLVRKLEALSQAAPGVRIDRAIVRLPTLLYRRPRAVAASLERLRALLPTVGEEVLFEMVECTPVLLMVRPQRLSAAMGVLIEALDGKELAIRVAERNPKALTMAPASLRASLAALASAASAAASARLAGSDSCGAEGEGASSSASGDPDVAIVTAAPPTGELVARMVGRAPSLLNRTPHALSDNCAALGAMLAEPAGISPPEAMAVASQMVVRQPSLLNNKTATLASKLAALKALLPTADVGRMVRAAPGLMASDVKVTLPRKIESLQRAFSPPLESRNELEMLLEGSPSLLTMQPEMLEEKMQRLLELVPDIGNYAPTTVGRFVLNSNERIERLAFVRECMAANSAAGSTKAQQHLKASYVLNMPQSKFMRRFPEYAVWKQTAAALQHGPM